MMSAQSEAGTEFPAGNTNSRRRVLFLADHLGLPDGGVHGVTTYLLDVLPALKQIGTDAAACFLREAHPAAESLRAHDIQVWFLDSRRFDLFVSRQVDELVRRGGYDILHCTQFRASIIGRGVARMRNGLAVVLHVHDLTMPPLPVRLMNRALARPVDLGICVSEAAREIAVRGYYVSPGRVRVLYTGIDTRVFRPLADTERAEVRAELGISAAAPVLCLVGRFHPVKGHREMIRMLKSIASRRPDCVLLLVGDGPERPACENLAKELRLSDNVRFLGHRDDVTRVLAAGDVAVVPSRSEGLSRFAIEANLCGLPVVAFASGGVAEALAGRACGELVPPGDPEAFVDAVDRVLGAPRSASAFDARVRAASERFELTAHVHALRACYDTLGAP